MVRSIAYHLHGLVIVGREEDDRLQGQSRVPRGRLRSPPGGTRKGLRVECQGMTMVPPEGRYRNGDDSGSSVSIGAGSVLRAQGMTLVPSEGGRAKGRTVGPQACRG